MTLHYLKGNYAKVVSESGRTMARVHAMNNGEWHGTMGFKVWLHFADEKAALRWIKDTAIALAREQLRQEVRQ